MWKPVRVSVSIRDLRTRLDASLEVTPSARYPERLTGRARAKTSRRLTAAYHGADGTSATLILDPAVEARLRRSLEMLAASLQARALRDKLEAGVARMQTLELAPRLNTSPGLRRYIRAAARGIAPGAAGPRCRETEPSMGVKPIESISSGAQAV